MNRCEDPDRLIDPTYYVCQECGDTYRDVDDLNEGPECCGVSMVTEDALREALEVKSDE